MINFMALEKKFNQVSRRERVLIFVTLLICVFSVSYFWVFEPAMLKQVKADKALHIHFNQEEKLDKELTEVNLQLQKDPLLEINKKIAFSLNALAELNTQLDKKLVKFIDAKKMANALSQVLSQSPGVTVVSLVSLPVSAFNKSGELAENEQQSANKSKVNSAIKDPLKANNVFYKHTLAINLKGNYNAIYQYFVNLEAIHEKFYWSVLRYKVDQYPNAEVMIQIYTVSEQQDLVSG